MAHTTDSNGEGTPATDRRMSAQVDRLERRIHDLEIADATQRGEIGMLKGQVDVLCKTAATSNDVKAASALSTVEVKAVSDLLTNKIDSLKIEVSGIKNYIAAGVGAVLLAVLAAVLAGVFK